MSNRKAKQAIALRLYEIRKQAGYSRIEMASRLGITNGGYNKNESGENSPCLDSLRRLSGDFEISMDWFFFNKGPMHYKEKGEREKELEKKVAELEEEQRKREEKAGTIEMRTEVRELLAYMENNAMFYFELMLYFQKFKMHQMESRELAESPALPGSS